MTQTRRWGITVPFEGVPLADHQQWYTELEQLGYTDVWSSEANGTDAFTPLALAAAWAPGLRLGQAIVPVYLRGPALLAMTVAALAEAAPGRFAVGLGTSSNVIVEQWNGMAFDQPYQRTRDTVRFLRAALTGEKVTEDYQTFHVKGFKLGRPPATVPPLLVAALRPGMLRLAGREADGVILNWLGAQDVPTVVKHVHDAGPGAEVVARIFVCPSEDADAVRQVARFAIAAYLNVPVYAEFHRFLGREQQLEPMWSAWQAKDRKAALAAIPDEVVDALVVHGSPQQCRDGVQAYVDNGVTTPAIAFLPVPGMDLRQAVRDLAPRG